MMNSIIPIFHPHSTLIRRILSVEKTLSVGLIGIGNMGSAHATMVGSGQIRGLRLAAVCDIDPVRLKMCMEKNPGVTGCEHWQELVADPSLDVVIVAVPHPLHADMAMAALRSGKHVLVEKPVDITVTKAAKLNEVAKASGKVFGIMFNQRTNPLFARARDMVKSGELGQLQRSVWIITNWFRTQSYYDSGTWRATWSGEGGGVLLNQAPHNLDLWQWICGMPTEITAFCDIAKYHNIEVEDDVTIFARYANGATGAFLTSTGESPGTNRLEITGTLGKVVIEEGVLKHWKLKKDVMEVCREHPDSFVAADFDYEEIPQTDPETAHPGILQNFANAILHGEELLAPGTDGIYELSISNAAYLSSARGNAPVKLPLNGQDFDDLLSSLIRMSHSKDNDPDSKYNTTYHQRWQVRW